MNTLCRKEDRRGQSLPDWYVSPRVPGSCDAGLHNFDLAGEGNRCCRMNDREDVVRGGIPSRDIDEKMPWDAVAVHGKDSVGMPQGSFDRPLCLATV